MSKVIHPPHGPPRRPRSLMLLGNNPYPQDPRVYGEATTLAAAGVEVTVVCPRWPGQAKREMLGGVRVLRFPHPPEGTSFLGYVLEATHVTAVTFVWAVRVLLRGGVDVVHMHNPPDTLLVVAASFKLLGKRFLYDHHDLAPELYEASAGERVNRVVYRSLILLETLACRLADHVITANASHRELEVARAGIAPEKVTVVRNGPDLARLRPCAGDPGIRSRAEFIVGWVGSMGHHDGIDHLLRAVHHLIHELGRSDVLCLLVGDGDAYAASCALAAELGIEDHVLFTGFVPYERIGELLGACDVCAVPDPSSPYNDRSTMIKVMEYMALAKPVVAYDLPETRVSAGTAAVYASPNDPRGLAQAMAALEGDPVRRATMGAEGRRRVQESLAWRYSVPPLLAAYAKLAPLSEADDTPPPRERAIADVDA
jgi:glycosyltransferase involved in cell wall biosynthesis